MHPSLASCGKSILGGIFAVAGVNEICPFPIRFQAAQTSSALPNAAMRYLKYSRRRFFATSMLLALYPFRSFLLTRSGALGKDRRYRR